MELEDDGDLEELEEVGTTNHRWAPLTGSWIKPSHPDRTSTEAAGWTRPRRLIRSKMALTPNRPWGASISTTIKNNGRLAIVATASRTAANPASATLTDCKSRLARKTGSAGDGLMSDTPADLAHEIFDLASLLDTILAGPDAELSNRRNAPCGAGNPREGRTITGGPGLDACWRGG